MIRSFFLEYHILFSFCDQPLYGLTSVTLYSGLFVIKVKFFEDY